MALKFRIEKRVWKHESPPGKPDHRGQERFCVVDEDSVVWDHFGTIEEAQAAFEILQEAE